MIGFNVFGWLRSQARTAVLGGISDALAEVATDAHPADLDQLRKLLATATANENENESKALPPAPEPEPEPEPAKGRKGR